MGSEMCIRDRMQKEFKVVVNETTAKRNGITIPQDILAKAEIVK